MCQIIKPVFLSTADEFLEQLISQAETADQTSLMHDNAAYAIYPEKLEPDQQFADMDILLM